VSNPLATLEEVEALVEQLDKVADPKTLAASRALLAAVLDIHRAGFSRMLELAPRDFVGALVGDPQIAPLLLLHGLHPEPIEVRAGAAVHRICPIGWTAEVTANAAGVLLVTLTRAGDPRRTATAERVRALVEQAVLESAPDAEGLELAGDVLDDSEHGFVSVDRLRAGAAAVREQRR
jgi:hypothetical protein